SISGRKTRQRSKSSNYKVALPAAGAAARRFREASTPPPHAIELLDPTRPGNACSILLVHCLPMPKSRGRKPKKKRTPTSAPKKRLDNFNTTPQEPALSTQPSQEPPLATAPRQEQPTPKIKQIAKLTTAVVLAAIAIVLCAYAF